jgi:hypothetical protein
MYDGGKYKEMLAKGWFQTPADLGLICSTDGGALFKSSGTSAWPIWGVNLNLSPDTRYL